VSQKSSAVRTVGRESTTAGVAHVRTPVHAHSYTHEHAPSKVPTLHMKPPISGIEGLPASSPCVHQCRCELSPVLKLHDSGIKRHHVANSHANTHHTRTKCVAPTVSDARCGGDGGWNPQRCKAFIEAVWKHHQIIITPQGKRTPRVGHPFLRRCGMVGVWARWQDCELECTAGVGPQSCDHTKKYLRRTLFISSSGHTCTSPTQCKTSLSQVCGVRKVARTTHNATCKASEGVQMGWAG
jgi:hypothetical protein